MDLAPLTLAEFLDWEERQPLKYEFRAGAIFSMAGTSDDHAQTVMNLSALIRPVLRGTRCRAYASDIKVVTDYPGSRFPDLLVTCDARDAKDRHIKRHPKLIIEVQSTRTASVDRGDKLDEYQTIAELEEYVLIDSRKRSVRMYRRDGQAFKTDLPTVIGSITLRTLDLPLTLDSIYEDVDFIQDARIPDAPIIPT